MIVHAFMNELDQKDYWYPRKIKNFENLCTKSMESYPLVISHILEEFHPENNGIHSNLGHLFVELAVNGRISIYFSLPMLIPSIDCKFHKRCPRFEWIPLLSWAHAVQTLWGFKNVHSWWNVAKSETIFWKECMITEQWKRVMLHNQTHKIVHSSAMYYQNLIIIHECSKKLLKMKNSKSSF